MFGIGIVREAQVASPAYLFVGKSNASEKDTIAEVRFVVQLPYPALAAVGGFENLARCIGDPAQRSIDKEYVVVTAFGKGCVRAEIARLSERLEDLGLANRTLMVFTSDHGEEFLEHGRHFHGNTSYGDMTNVPLIVWGADWVPPGTVVEQTVQSLDLYPTLLELCGLPVPDGVQGQSLVPLIRGTRIY